MGVPLYKFRSFNNLRIYNASLTANANAMYSDSVEERVTSLIFPDLTQKK